MVVVLATMAAAIIADIIFRKSMVICPPNFTITYNFDSC